MSYIYHKTEFINLLKKCLESNNIYVSGGWGVNLKGKWLEEVVNGKNAYNKNHADQIRKAAERQPCWGWDCVCLLKSLAWSFTFDQSAKHGGAKYESNQIKDYGTKKFFETYCSDIKWIDSSSVIPEGALVWEEGHIATSIGNGLAIESTRYGDAVVRIVGIRGIYKGSEYPKRHFDKWGYCQFIDYRDKGDVDGDGEITVKDYLLAKKIVLGTYDPTPAEKWAADMNDDGEVTALDYLMIKKKVLS